MIAVFTSKQHFFEEFFRCTPQKNFINVRSIQDIRGRKFEGAIFYHDWYNNAEVDLAYQELLIRQPELFK